MRLGRQARLPRMAVRRHTPWYWYAALLAAIVLLTVAASQQAFNWQSQQSTTDPVISERPAAPTDVPSPTSTLNALRADLDTARRQLQIANATRGDLMQTVSDLQNENTRLKEDIAVLRALIMPVKEKKPVQIYQFSIQASMRRTFSYTLVLMQAPQSDHDFEGTIEFIPSGSLKPNKPISRQSIRFRHYDRLEGVWSGQDLAGSAEIEVRVYGQNSTKVLTTKTVKIETDDVSQE